MEKATLIKGIKKLVNKIKDYESNKTIYESKIEDLEKATKKGERLNRVLMIARELKGKLIEAFTNKSLKDKELAFVKKEAADKDLIINKTKLEIETATAKTEL